MRATLTSLDQAVSELLGCVCEALDHAATVVPNHPGCPCRVCTHAGQPAWDACCDCPPAGGHGGQLHVWSGNMWPYVVFPDPAPATPKCLPSGSGIAAELVVTLLRCAPTVDEHGNPPSCDLLEPAARVLHVDKMAVMAAATCCFPTAGAGRARRILVREHATVGPEGGCVGSELRLVADLGPVCCPEHTSG